MSIQTVWLHVGHGKTGSSFIQSALALSSTALEQAGLHYPIRGRAYERALAGQISSGNLMPEKGSLARLLGTLPPPAGATGLLLSSEHMFRTLFGRARIIDEVRESFPEARIKALMFIRDPMDHMVSRYQQGVKRGGSPETIDEYCAAYDIPELVGNFLDHAAAEGVEVTVYNYSRQPDALLSRVENWLGLDAEALVRPPVARVNRSISNAEMELLRAFTRHLGSEFAHAVSIALCDQLPDVKSERPRGVAGDVLQVFLDRMAREIAVLNMRLPEAEAYQVGTIEDYAAMIADETAAAHYSFSAEQIDVVARAIHERIAKLGKQGQAPARAAGKADLPRGKTGAPAAEKLTGAERQQRQRERAQRKAARERRLAERGMLPEENPQVSEA